MYRSHGGILLERFDPIFLSFLRAYQERTLSLTVGTRRYHPSSKGGFRFICRDYHPCSTVRRVKVGLGAVARPVLCEM